MLFSAALIVKNEERCLEPCLRSLEDLVDEIVVVDTGSSDRTKDIARRFDARIFDFTWCNDFAAARNDALNRVRGDWVVYVDADERVRAGQAAQLREGLEHPDFVAYTVQLHPHPASTAYPELRIFRNDPRIRFRGRIHENIWPGIELYQSQHGGLIGASGLTIDHEGYQADQTSKHLRNLPLLQSELREDPGRVYCWCHLANIHAALGEDDSAEQAWMRALGLVRQKNTLRADDCLPYLGLIEWKTKHRLDPQPLLTEALNRFPGNLQLHWLHGTALMDTQQFREAIRVFDHLIACGNAGGYDRAMAYDQRLLGELPLSALATCYFQLREYATSGHYFGLAARCAPDNLEYRVKLELCAQLGRSGVPTPGRSAPLPDSPGSRH